MGIDSAACAASGGREGDVEPVCRLSNDCIYPEKFSLGRLGSSRSTVGVLKKLFKKMVNSGAAAAALFDGTWFDGTHTQPVEHWNRVSTSLDAPTV